MEVAVAVVVVMVMVVIMSTRKLLAKEVTTWRIDIEIAVIVAVKAAITTAETLMRATSRDVITMTMDDTVVVDALQTVIQIDAARKRMTGDDHEGIVEVEVVIVMMIDVVVI